MKQTAEQRRRGYEEIFRLNARQQALMVLGLFKGWPYVIEAVRTRPEELKEYLEGKI